MKIIITILAAMAVINAVIAYACCVVAGRADDVEILIHTPQVGAKRSVRNDNSRSFRG